MFIEEKQAFHWRQAKRNKQEVNICTRLLFGTLLVSAVASTPVLAAPGTGTVTGGNTKAEITTPTPTDVGITHETRIDQHVGRVDIAWDGFDTTSTELVRFVQPHGNAVAINRVTNGTRTTYDGFLKANGHVYLINRHGITFGATAQVNVGALLATTSEPTNLPEFLAAPGVPLHFDGRGYATVINDGNITINGGVTLGLDENSGVGGFAILAAPYVENNGTIQANAGEFTKIEDEEEVTVYKEGHVQLASTQRFTLNRGKRDDGSNNPPGLLDFHDTPEFFQSIEGEQPGELAVTNTGTLRSRSGNVFLRSNMLPGGGGLAQTVNLSGVVDADALASDPLTGGKILVTSVTDIKIGDADIHAIGGQKVRGIFKAADNIESVDGTQATIVINAIVDHDAPNVDDSEANDADAKLRMVANTDDDGGDIDFTGTIDVGALTNSTYASSADTAGAEADAYADIDGDNVALNGGLYVGAISLHNHDNHNADADADLDVDANNGDLIINGEVSVAAAAAVGSYGMNDADAHAYAEANLTADNDVIITDDGLGILDQTLLVGAVSSNSASRAEDADAFATLNINAGGRIDIRGRTEMLAAAGLTGGEAASLSQKAETADVDARATLNYNAEDGIMIDGAAETGAVTNVEAIAENMINGGYTSEADANINMDGGEGGDGGLTYNGDMLARADALLGEGGTYDVDADANINLRATGDINITTGNATIEAEGIAVSEADFIDRDASGDAYITIDSREGSVDVIGRLKATGTAESVVVEDDQDGGARVNIYADNDVSIEGAIEVTGVVTGQSTDDTAEADAHLYIEAGNDGHNGSITMTNTTVDVSATTTIVPQGDEDQYDVEADASVEYNATDAVTLNNVTTNIRAEATDNSGREGADVKAYYEIYASDIAVTGNTNVEAIAKGVDGVYSNGSIYTDADAYVEFVADGAEGEGPGDLTITGDINVTATATVTTAEGDEPETGSYSAASADAYVTLVAYNDLTMNGDVNVNATGGSAVSREDNGKGKARLWMVAGAEGIPSTYIPNGSIMEDKLGTIDENLSEVIHNDGDLYFEGDINVNGTGNATGAYSADAEAEAEAVLAAGGDTTIITDPVTTRATANSTTTFDGGEGYSNANADSTLYIEAGLHREYVGEDEELITHDLFIRGDVASHANATATNADTEYGETNEEQYAMTALRATGAVTVRGQDPLAQAGPAQVQQQVTGFQACEDGSCDPIVSAGEEEDGIYGYDEKYEYYANTVAQLVIDGNDVDIQPDETKDEVVLPTLIDRPDLIQLIEPDFPGSRPPTFDAQGNFVASDSLEEEGEPVAPLGLEDDDPVIAGDPTALLPPTAAGPAEAARTRTNHDRLVR